MMIFSHPIHPPMMSKLGKLMSYCKYKMTKSHQKVRQVLVRKNPPNNTFTRKIIETKKNNSSKHFKKKTTFLKIK